MKKDILICIAYHHIPERLKWLKMVVNNILNNYHVSLKIIIDTNTSEVDDIWEYIGVHGDIWIESHPDLEHPFHLTRMHRKHFEINIDKYDVFFYCEDDEVLSFENYLAALEKYELMWPQGAVPTFIRIEESDGKQYISDVPRHQNIHALGITEINGRYFTSLPFPFFYNGFWVMPQKYLRENMIPGFTKMSDAREWAAMYPTWELNKKSLLEVYEEDGKWFIHPNNYSYHLPNNYIGSSMGNASIEVKNVFL